LVPSDTFFIFIGAEYDLAISETVFQKMVVEDKKNGLHLVGQLEIGGTIEVIKQMDYLFTFPSGIGFLADVVNTPNTMWFPDKLDRMRYTFVDPKNWDTGRTIHRLFTTPEDAITQFREGYGIHQFNHSLEKRRKHVTNSGK
jgi:ADP-heptose:LPS heptosyltransferase